jgi:CBS domain-containing protein
MREDVTLRDAMTREFVGVSESDTVSATAELLAAEEADGAVVLRGEEPVGRLSATGLLRAMSNGADPSNTPVSAVMADPPPVLPPDARVGEAALALSEEHGWRVLVSEAEGAGVAGTVDARDVLTAGLVSPENGSGGSGSAAGEMGLETEIEPEAEAESESEGARAGIDGRDPGTPPSTDAAAAAATVTEQSICEDCGALAGDVRHVDGRALCSNCREV